MPFFPLRLEAEELSTRLLRRTARGAIQVKIAWLLQRSLTMAPIPGTLSFPHLLENLTALNFELSDDEFGRLVYGGVEPWAS